MIQLENISKTYVSVGKRVDALKNIDLSVDEGEVFGFIGRSGAGKSTLIRMLNLLERPSTGHVRVDGDDITTYSDARLREYRRGVGMVFQHFNLLRARTVIDNVSFPLRLAGVGRAEREKRALEVLELVELTGHERKYPSQLSGGQQQRVGIARALASGPRLLLCDEATSALDPQTTQSILSLLGDINRRLGLTIILITHSMDVIRAVCDRVAVLEGGEVVESGDVLDVFLKPQHPATRALLSESAADAGGNWQASAQAAGIGQNLIRINFRGASTTRPLLSRLSRDLQLDMSILQGAVGRIKDTPYGQLVVAIEGPSGSMQALEQALSAENIDYEVLA